MIIYPPPNMKLHLFILRQQTPLFTSTLPKLTYKLINSYAETYQKLHSTLPLLHTSQLL